MRGSLRIVIPAPTDEQIRAILAKHGLPSDHSVEECPYEGVVNHVRLIGDVCVRTLKDPDFASDILTETLAVPVVRRAGARVPEMMVFDSDEDIYPGYITIYERIRGRPLGVIPEFLDLGTIYRDLAHEIGQWHRGVRHLHDPNKRLDSPELDDADLALRNNADRMTPEEIDWTEKLIGRLGDTRSTTIGFVHWDLHANNVMIVEDRLCCVMDWGDAGWGDPAINFRTFPAVFLPQALDTFGLEDEGLIASALTGTLSYALGEIHYPNDPNFPNFPSGHKCWDSLRQLYQLRLDDAWCDLLGDEPPDCF